MFAGDVKVGDFVTVAKVGEIPPGEGRAFTVNSRRVAIFFQKGAYYAINDTCPHMGASLADGYLDDTGVLCPWHAWKFCVRNGTWLDNPKSQIKTDTYEVRVSGDEIQVMLRHPEPKKS